MYRSTGRGNFASAQEHRTPETSPPPFERPLRLTVIMQRSQVIARWRSLGPRSDASSGPGYIADEPRLLTRHTLSWNYDTSNAPLWTYDKDMSSPERWEREGSCW